MDQKRIYIQSRNLRNEAEEKLTDFDSILDSMKKEYESLRGRGIFCKAFAMKENERMQIYVTRQCWNHLFKHPVKRPSKVEKLERALCFPLAIKLLEKTTTYQEVSKEKDKGGNQYLFFGIIGYIRGSRIKVVIRKQVSNVHAQFVLFSFYQMSTI